MPRFSSLLIVAIALSLCANAAWAQQNPDIEKAKQHYMAGEQALQAEDFKKAAAEYTSAYEITKDPVLFFKIASAHDRAGNCADALVYYRRYLAEGNPPEQFKTMASDSIAVCEQKTAGQPAGKPDGAQPDAAKPDGAKPDGAKPDGAKPDGAKPDATKPDAAATNTDTDNKGEPDIGDTGDADATGDIDPMGGQRPPSFVDQKPTWQRNTAWIGVGTAITFATAGAILGLSASSHEEDIKNLINFRYPNGDPAEYTGNARAQYEELVSEGESLELWSRIALGAAAASAVAATVLFIIDPGPAAQEQAARITPTVSPDGFGVAAGWRF